MPPRGPACVVSLTAGALGDGRIALGVGAGDGERGVSERISISACPCVTVAPCATE